MGSQITSLALERFTTFGELLKFLRRRAGLTQLELSIAVGYSDAQISRLELNQRVPDLAMITARFVPVLELNDEPEVASRLFDLASAMTMEYSPETGTAPYKGLYSFIEADTALFYGREKLTDHLLERISTSLSSEPPMRFLTIVGASGSGKSSLLWAGLTPALRRKSAFARRPIFSMTPTNRPLQALASCLGLQSLAETSQLMDDLARDRRTLYLFAVERLNKGIKAQPVQPAFLLIDQFEELFTLCKEEAEKQAFIDNLMTAATEPGGGLFIVITLRADFYGHCAPYAALRDLLALEQIYIGPMTTGEMRHAIEEPARRGNWELEKGLVDILLRDVGADEGHVPEPGALPLLSHVLLETWRRRHGRTLTLSGYLSSGGVQGAIAETAEMVFQDELDARQREIARAIFLHLTNIGEDGAVADTRRRVTQNELLRSVEEATQMEEVLNRLVAARLVIADDRVVELAHEALIREWPRLRVWLDEDREGLLLHRRLTEAAEVWESHGRDDGDTYRGLRLSQVQNWAAAHPGELSPVEQTFLEVSQFQAQQEEMERQAVQHRELEAARELAEIQRTAAAQLRRRAIYLGVAFILAIIMAGIALMQGNQARKAAITAQVERRISYARELSAAAVNSLETDPERSILLALQAVSTTRSTEGIVLPEAEEALHRSILASQVRLTLSGLNQWVISTTFSPDGKSVAAIGVDGAVLMWDAVTGAEQLRIPGNTIPGDAFGMQRIAFHPDGKQIATGDGNLVKIWDAASGAEILTLSGHLGDVWAVAFSPDGSRVASGGVDGSVRLWDAVTGKELFVLNGHEDAVEGLAFRPDGSQLASVGDDQAVRIWDVVTGKLVAQRAEFDGPIDSVAYSPDGESLAITTTSGLYVWNAGDLKGDARLSILENTTNTAFSPDGTRLAAITGSVARLWDAQTGRELVTLAGHTGWVIDLAFSPDGKRMATTSFDQTVKVWSIAPGEEVITLAGKGDYVVYSQDGSLMATDGADGSASIWDAFTGEQLHTLMGHTAPVMSVAFSPDGKRLATASLDTSVKIWDTASGELVLTLLGHAVGVRDVTFSPDGKRIATAGFDQTARIWELETGKELLKLSGHDGLVLGVAFSPDGQRLGTSSSDRTAKVWDATTGRLLLTLSGHEDPIPDITFSPDGMRIATASQDGTVKIWDAASGKEIIALTGHGSEIQSVVFSSDGKWIATGSGDNSAKIWETVSGKELLTLVGSLGGVNGVAFRPGVSDATLAVASTDGIVRVYLLSIDRVIALAKTRLTRSFRPDECRKYLHLAACPAGMP